MKPIIYLQRDDGMCVLPDGTVMLEVPGLSEGARLLRRVLQAHRQGVELFPGQADVAPLVASVFDQPLCVRLTGKLQFAPTPSAPRPEFRKVEIAKPADGVMAAVLAIRALYRDD